MQEGDINKTSQFNLINLILIEQLSIFMNRFGIYKT